ncbi:MAG: nucleoside-diphosphate-sugar epimerase [Marinoscillum sp.]|jgi:nucleoside-diphosphate-sugar epimerase
MPESKTISILGCGWLGFPLGEALVADGYNVKGSTTRAEKLSKLRNSGITPFLLDLNPDSYHSAPFFSSKHLIVNLPPRNRNGIEGFHQKQLEHVKAAAKKNGVKKIIFVSSTGVYPDSNCEVKEADASLNSLNRSGLSLLALEENFISSSFETTIIRFGGLYGPDRNPGNFLEGKKDLGGADNPVNMIHRDDCIGVIQHILKEQLWGYIFNACSPNLPTRQEFYHAAAMEIGVKPPSFNGHSKPYKKVNQDLLLSKGYSFKH